ncbi:MAG TPA: choice-of-anchor B family protein [Bacteroidia bacterium]|jgi:choice-of-anchor B domain-containing protein
MKLQRMIACASLAICMSASMFAQNLNLVQRSHYPYPGKTCANITGYVDTTGREYALVGVSDGLSIVDVTDPVNPVQVKKIPNIDDLWKEVKVYGKYAYVTTEGGGGLQIVNMSSLPNAAGIVYHSWQPVIPGAGGGTLESIHALHIDGHFVYLYGSNLFNGGAIAADLTDPWNPVYAGKYEVGSGNQAYVHDGYVRNDTLYAGHIYAGYFSIVDFTNKSAPVEIANQFTPNNFTHNTWLSTDSKTLFTTDEVDGSYVTSYNITDPANIVELDRIQSNPGSQSIGHNTHIIQVNGNDYAVTSWYKDGLTIVDAGRPHNLVQVANYDNYAGSGGGFEGNWGVYPYLPSGNIIASNIEDGLYVYTPTYERACYLEGIITDSVTGLPLNGASIEILSTSVNENTTISGNYATGIPSPGGTFSVKYSKAGYLSKTFTNISLVPAGVTLKDVALVPVQSFSMSGQVITSGTGIPVANANILISNPDFSYQATTNASGNFTISGMYADTYEIIAGKWGYVTSCVQNTALNNGTAPLVIELAPGYYDDFTFNFGWAVSGNAATGDWERGIPVGTTNAGSSANPGADDNFDCGDKAYVTGNGGGAAADDDVDNGSTLLTSPIFDLSTFTNPYVNYSRWFFNGGGAGSPNDSVTIKLSNGISTVMIDFARFNSPGNSSWVPKAFQVSNFIAPTSNMRIQVRTADLSTSGHLVEAGFDQFSVTEGLMTGVESIVSGSSLNAYPNPFSSEINIAFKVTEKLSDAAVIVSDVTGRMIDKRSIDQQEGTIIFENLNAGIYFVNIQNGNTPGTPVKIIKLK